MSKCTCVYATSRNSESVRKGYAVGGYLKKRCDNCKADKALLSAGKGSDISDAIREAMFDGYGVEVDGNLVYQDEEKDWSTARVVRDRDHSNGQVVRWWQKVNGPTVAHKLNQSNGRLL